MHKYIKLNIKKNKIKKLQLLFLINRYAENKTKLMIKIKDISDEKCHKYVSENKSLSIDLIRLN